eukprot:scaffold435_cov342-Pavlova_lutheri.AAC.35
MASIWRRSAWPLRAKGGVWRAWKGTDAAAASSRETRWAEENASTRDTGGGRGPWEQELTASRDAVQRTNGERVGTPLPQGGGRDPGHAAGEVGRVHRIPRRPRRGRGVRHGRADPETGRQRNVRVQQTSAQSTNLELFPHQRTREVRPGPWKMDLPARRTRNDTTPVQRTQRHVWKRTGRTMKHQ